MALVVAAANIGEAAAQATYIRVGMHLDQPAETRFRDVDCTSASPAALYGCGKGNDGAWLSSSGEFGPAAGVEVGIGIAATPGLRLESTIAYQPRFSFDGRANFRQTSARQVVSADLWSLSGMVAANMDRGVVALCILNRNG